MKSVISLATTLFATFSLAAVCVEKTTVVPQGWKKLDNAVDPNSPIQFSIALRQPEMHKLHKSILDFLPLKVHVSLDEINVLRTPSTSDVDDVLDWLKKNGVTTTETNYDWINVRTTVQTAEKLLQTKLSNYAYEDMEPVLRTTEYNLPDDLDGAISFVHPLANFMSPYHQIAAYERTPPTFAKNDDNVDCHKTITPKCIRDLYNIDYRGGVNGRSNIRLAIAGFLEQYANYADYDMFAQKYIPDIAKTGYNFSTELVNGGTNSQVRNESGIEAALDIDYGMAIGYPSQVTFFATGGRGVTLDDNGKEAPASSSTNEPFVDLLQHFLSMPDDKLPHVLSLSYADDEISVPKPYAERVCSMMGMLTSRGMTILGGSGDGGASGAQGSTCMTNDGTNKRITMPTFPASCPWVTSVGATQSDNGPLTGAKLSGGGFSRLFAQPSWQKQDVAAYVKQLNGRLDGYYMPDKRAMPDISVVGTLFSVAQNNRFTLVNGTSASTPLMASMIALVNDARAAQGKKSIGFLNPLLYSSSVKSVLEDVTHGESYSCVYNGEQPGGWPATKGWDAMTGLGVPSDFSKFLEALKRM